MEKDETMTVIQSEKALIDMVRSISSGEVRITVENGILTAITPNPDMQRENH